MLITSLLVLLLASVLAGGVYLIMNVRKAETVEFPLPYTREGGNVDDILGTQDAALAATYGLCVGKDNQAYSGLSLSGNASGALFSMSEGEVAFSDGMFKKIYPASITKLMTALIVLRDGNLSDTVTIEESDITLEDGAQVSGFAVGDKVSLEVLLKAFLIQSGNDAAMAAARHVGGTLEDFVAEMNATAKKIGATGTHFVNPTGLHDSEHYTTVYDIYLILNELRNYPEFEATVHAASYTAYYQDAASIAKHVSLTATDRYLTKAVKAPKDVAVIGGKTGTTNAAGHCLALLSQNAFGELYCSIIVGETSNDALYSDMNALLSVINDG